MGLMKETTSAAIDTTAIHPRRPDPRKVCRLERGKERYCYRRDRRGNPLPLFSGHPNVCNYFLIAADEVTEGLWEISWSTDMKTIQTEGVQHDA